MKKYIFVGMVALLLIAQRDLQASLFTVDAFLHSSTVGQLPNIAPGVGLNTGIYLSAGQMFTTSADSTDLWSAGASPRWSNADGLTHTLLATGSDETGLPANTLIGTNWGMWTQSGLTAPYGSLVGELGGTFFLLGSNFSGPAPASGTLKLFFWDENNYDNTHTVDVNINAVPEPGSFILVGIGLIGVVAFMRRATVRVGAKSK